MPLRCLFIRQGPEMSAQDAEATFRMKLTPGAPALYRLSRQTGKSETVLSAGAKELVVTLPGGTGDLFKWNDDAFAGLTPAQP